MLINEEVLRKYAEYQKTGSVPWLNDQELEDTMNYLKQAEIILRCIGEYNLATRCLSMDIHVLDSMLFFRKNYKK